MFTYVFYSKTFQWVMCIVSTFSYTSIHPSIHPQDLHSTFNRIICFSFQPWKRIRFSLQTRRIPLRMPSSSSSTTSEAFHTHTYTYINSQLTRVYIYIHHTLGTLFSASARECGAHQLIEIVPNENDDVEANERMNERPTLHYYYYVVCVCVWWITWVWP